MVYLGICVSLCFFYTLNSYNAHYIIRNEKEIEIAASLGPRRKRCSGFSASGDNDEQAHHDDHDDADDHDDDNEKIALRSYFQDDSGSGCSEDVCRGAVEGLNITSPVPSRPIPAQVDHNTIQS